VNLNFEKSKKRGFDAELQYFEKNSYREANFNLNIDSSDHNGTSVLLDGKYFKKMLNLKDGQVPLVMPANQSLSIDKPLEIWNVSEIADNNGDGFKDYVFTIPHFSYQSVKITNPSTAVYFSMDARKIGSDVWVAAVGRLRTLSNGQYVGYLEVWKNDQKYFSRNFDYSSSGNSTYITGVDIRPDSRVFATGQKINNAISKYWGFAINLDLVDKGISFKEYSVTTNDAFGGMTRCGGSNNYEYLIDWSWSPCQIFEVRNGNPGIDDSPEIAQLYSSSTDSVTTGGCWRVGNTLWACGPATPTKIYTFTGSGSLTQRADTTNYPYPPVRIRGIGGTSDGNVVYFGRSSEKTYYNPGSTANQLLKYNSGSWSYITAPLVDSELNSKSDWYSNVYDMKITANGQGWAIVRNDADSYLRSHLLRSTANDNWARVLNFDSEDLWGLGYIDDNLLYVCGYEIYKIQNVVDPDSYESDNSFATAREVTVGYNLVSQSRTISPSGDNDYIKFYANSGATYVFNTTGSTDTYGYIYDGSYALKTSDDNSGGGVNFKITFTPSSSGYYYLKICGATSSITGTYTLYCVDPFSPQTPTQPTGRNGYAGESITFKTHSHDKDMFRKDSMSQYEIVRFGWDWNGDTQVDEWTDWVSRSGNQADIAAEFVCEFNHVFGSAGTYSVRVMAQDSRNLNSMPQWSNPLSVTISRDTTNPSITINSLINDRSVCIEYPFNISGTASDSPSGIDCIQVSTDGGSTWYIANGKDSWYYHWTPTEGELGMKNIIAKAVDKSQNVNQDSRQVCVAWGLKKDGVPYAPNVDGYNFYNYVKPTQTWDMMRETYLGISEDYEHAGLFQRIFYDNTYKTLFDKGVCYGMAASDVALYYGSEDISKYDPPNSQHIRELSQSNALEDLIEIYFGKQMTDQIMAHRIPEMLFKNPAGFYLMGIYFPGSYDEIEQNIKNSDGDPLVVSFLNGGGGHTVTPYATAKISDKYSRVYVYDSNHKNDLTRYVVFDHENNKFYYSYDGSFRYNYSSPSYAVVTEKLSLVQSAKNYLFSSILDNLIICCPPIASLVDCSGNITHFENGNITNEIPGVVPIYSSEDKSVFCYAVNKSLAHLKYIYINGTQEDGKYNLLMYDANGIYGISNATCTSETVDRIDTNNSNGKLCFSLKTNDAEKNLNFLVGNLTSENATKTGILNVTLRNDGSITAEVSQNRDGLSISSNDCVNFSYDLTLEKSKVNDIRAFHIYNISNSGNESQIFIVNDWNNMSTVPVTCNIDRENDGVVEESHTYYNQTYKLPTYSTNYSILGNLGNNGWYNGTVQITLSVSNSSAVSRTYYKIDNGSWLSYSVPFVVGSNGWHLLPNVRVC
jgi:hypothetical protein